ncbi:MAG: DUF1080 domain-containing protein [Verrucomicrobiaceae bacterium]|nr:DUF1080 domain-containing protein [Verrucomicrobiaceae bacterium]
MIRQLLLSVLLASAFTVSAEEPVTLFDGKSFTGWEGDTEKTWRIEDGQIVAGSLTTKVPRNEFLSSKEDYADFELTLEFKLQGVPGGGMINAGVQIRSERIPNNHEMIGYQADIGDPKYWGALYDESRRKKILAEVDMAKVEPVLKRADWNTYTIRCQGPRIQLFINGVQTVDYTEADAAIPLKGKIALQVHSGGPTEVRYRNIKIKKL